MLLAFTGDPYLARREALAEAEARGLPPRLVAPGPESLEELLAPNLFGEGGGVLDMREVESERWQRLQQELERAAGSLEVLVYDPSPTRARARVYQKLGEVKNYPAPRFRERAALVESLLRAQGVEAPRAVVQLLAASEADTEGLVREVEKIALLTPPITPEKVRPLMAWPQAQNAFDLAEPLARGAAREALALASELMDRGEAPVRILGALAWHYAKLAELGFLLEKNPRPREAELAKEMKLAPFVVKKLLASHRRLGARRVERSLEVLVEAELKAKSGGDPATQLLTAIHRLASL